MTVYDTIQNQGGEGNILVTFNVYQGGNKYDKIKSIYLLASESQELDVTFDEVTRLGGDITFYVQANSR